MIAAVKGGFGEMSARSQSDKVSTLRILGVIFLVLFLVISIVGALATERFNQLSKEGSSDWMTSMGLLSYVMGALTLCAAIGFLLGALICFLVPVAKKSSQKREPNVAPLHLPAATIRMLKGLSQGQVTYGSLLVSQQGILFDIEGHISGFKGTQLESVELVDAEQACELVPEELREKNLTGRALVIVHPLGSPPRRPSLFVVSSEDARKIESRLGPTGLLS